MEDARITINAGMETEGIQAGSKEMQTAIKSLQRTVRDVDKSLRTSLAGYSEAVKSSGASTDTAYDKLQRLKDEAERLRSALSVQQATPEFKKMADEAEAARQELERLRQKREEMRPETRYFDTDEYKYTMQALREMEEELNRWTRARNAVAKRRDGLGEIIDPAAFNKASQAIKDIKAQMEEAQAVIEHLAQTEEPFSKMCIQVDDAEKKVRSLEAQMKALQERGAAYTTPPGAAANQEQLQQIEQTIAAMEAAAQKTPKYQEQVKQHTLSQIEQIKSEIAQLEQESEQASNDMAELGRAAFGSSDAYNEWVDRLNETGFYLVELAEEIGKMEFELEGLQAELEDEPDSGFEDWAFSEDDVRETRARIDEITKEIQNYKQILSDFSAAFAGTDMLYEWHDLDKQFMQTNDRLVELRERAEQLRATLVDGAKDATEAEQKKQEDLGKSNDPRPKKAQEDAKAAGDAADKAKDKTKEMKDSAEEASASVEKSAAKATSSSTAGISKIVSVASRAGASIRHFLVGAFESIARAAMSAARTIGSALVGAVSGVARGFSTAISTVGRFGKAIANIGGVAVKGAISGLGKLASAAMNAASSIARIGSKTVVNGIKKVGSYAWTAAKAMMGFSKANRGSDDSLKRSLMTIIKYTFGVRSMFFLFRRLRKVIAESFGELAKADSGTNKAISSMVSATNRLKGSFSAAFQPLVTAVAPILTKFVNMLSDAMTEVGKFFAMLTGQDYYLKVTAKTVDYAESLDKSTKSTKDATKATKELNEEQENQLASFDQLNILSAQKDKNNNKTDTDKDDDESTFNVEKIPLSGVSDFIQKLKDAFAKGDWEEIGKILADKINGIFGKLNDLISWENIGEKITKIVNAFTTVINSLIDNIDWPLIGTTIGSGVNTIVNTLNLLYEGIHWEDLGAHIGEGLNALVLRIDWTALGHLFANKINAWLDSIHGFISSFDFSTAGAKLAEGVMALINWVHWDKLGDDLAGGIQGAIEALTGFVQNFSWGDAGKTFASIVNELVTLPKWEQLGTDLGNMISDALYELTEFVENFKWEDAGRTFANTVKALAGEVYAPDVAFALMTMIMKAFKSFRAFVAQFDWLSEGEEFGAAVMALAETFDPIEVGNALAEALNSALDFLIGALNSFNEGTGDESGWEMAANKFGATILLLQSKGHFDTLGKILADSLNGALEFLLTLVGNFDWGEQGRMFGEKVNKILTQVKWDLLGRALGTLAGGAIQHMVNALTTFDFEAAAAGLSATLDNFLKEVSTWAPSDEDISKMSSNLTAGINKFIYDVPWKKLGETLGNLFYVSLYFLFSTISRTNWAALGSRLADGITEALSEDNVHWTQLGTNAGDACNKIIDGIKTFFINFPAAETGANIGKFLRNAIRTIKWGNVASAISQGIKTAFTLLTSALKSISADDTLTKALGDFIAGVDLQGILTSALNFATALMDSLDTKQLGTDIAAKIGEVDWDTAAKTIWDLLKIGFGKVVDFADALFGSSDGPEIIWDDGYVEPDTSLGQKIGKKLAELLSKINWQEFGEFLRTTANNLFDAINSFFQELATPQNVDGVSKSKLQVAVESFFTGIDWYGIAASIVKAAWNAFKTIGETLLNVLVDAFRDPEYIQKQIYDEAVSGFVGASTALSEETVEQFYESFKKTVMDESGNVKSEFKYQIGLVLGEGAVAALESGEDMSSQLFAALNSGLGNDPDIAFAKQQLNGAIDRITEGSGDKGTELADSIVDGLTGELDSRKQEVTDAMEGALLEPYETNVEGTPGFDMGSPSKRTRELGKNVVLGFTGGLSDEETSANSETKTMFEGLFNTIVGTCEAMHTVQTLISNALHNIEVIIPIFTNKYKVLFDTGWESITTDTANRFTQMSQTIDTALNNVNSNIVNKLGLYAATFRSGWNTIGQNVSSYMNTIKSAISSGLVAVANDVSYGVQNIANIINSQNWYSVGSNIANGIANGLNSSWGWLTSTVWNLAIDMYNAACAALGIASPSKLFEKGVGMMVGAGITEGLDNSETGIMAKINSISNDMFKGMSQLDAIGSSVTFRTPAVALGNVLPYNVSGQISSDSKAIVDAVETSNDDLANVVIQATNNAAIAIVNAIQRYSGGNQNEGDVTTRTRQIINEINRMTRAQGQSPLLI